MFSKKNLKITQVPKEESAIYVDSNSRKFVQTLRRNVSEENADGVEYLLGVLETAEEKQIAINSIGYVGRFGGRVSFDEKQNSCLHLSIDPRTIQILLANGADETIKNAAGETALDRIDRIHQQISTTYNKIVEADALLSGGQDVQPEYSMQEDEESEQPDKASDQVAGNEIKVNLKFVQDTQKDSSLFCGKEFGYRVGAFRNAVTEGWVEEAEGILGNFTHPNVKKLVVNLRGCVETDIDGTKRNVDFDSEGNGMVAVAGNDDMVDFLVSHGADLFARNNLGETPDKTLARHSATEVATRVANLQLITPTPALHDLLARTKRMAFPSMDGNSG